MRLRSEVEVEIRVGGAGGVENVVAGGREHVALPAGAENAVVAGHSLGGVQHECIAESAGICVACAHGQAVLHEVCGEHGEVAVNHGVEIPLVAVHHVLVKVGRDVAFEGGLGGSVEIRLGHEPCEGLLDVDALDSSLFEFRLDEHQRSALAELALDGVDALFVLDEVEFPGGVAYERTLGGLRAGHGELHCGEKRLRVHIRGALLVSIVADKIRNDDRGKHCNDTHNDDKLNKREALFVPHSLKVLYHTIFRLS